MKFTQRTWLKSAASATALTLMLGGCVSAPDTRAAIASKTWRVDAAQSSVNFVTLKAGQAGVGGVAEVQAFRRFSGALSADGQIKFTIDLASVDTGVDIRDERLRTMLFNVGATPQATFTAKLDAATLKGIDTSSSRDVDVEGALSLAGSQKPVAAKLRVVRLGSDAMMVTTRAPIVVNANDHGMRAGVEAMREVMGLNFLASAAPVTFALVLNEKR